MTVLDVLQRLYELGGILTPYPDGTVRCRAPKGTLTPALVDAMRQYKPELHALVEAWSERAAIAEWCAGLSRPAAEALAWQCMLTPHDGCAACGYESENAKGDDHE